MCGGGNGFEDVFLIAQYSQFLTGNIDWGGEVTKMRMKMLLVLGVVMVISGCGFGKKRDPTSQQAALPLNAIDGYVASMLNTPNDSVFLNLGGIGQKSNALSFVPENGIIKMRISCANKTQRKHAEAMIKIAKPLQINVFPDRDLDLDGGGEIIGYVFELTGKPDEVGTVIVKLIADTFSVAGTEECYFQYQNMPATFTVKRGEEPKQVSLIELQQGGLGQERVYLGESNRVVYFRDRNQPLSESMKWNKEIWQIQDQELPAELLDSLRCEPSRGSTKDF